MRSCILFEACDCSSKWAHFKAMPEPWNLFFLYSIKYFWKWLVLIKSHYGPNLSKPAEFYFFQRFTSYFLVTPRNHGIYLHSCEILHFEIRKRKTLKTFFRQMSLFSLTCNFKIWLKVLKLPSTQSATWGSSSRHLLFPVTWCPMLILG